LGSAFAARDILVVDYEATLRDLLKNALVIEGYDVRFAEGSETAFKILKNGVRYSQPPAFLPNALLVSLFLLNYNGGYQSFSYYFLTCLTASSTSTGRYQYTDRIEIIVTTYVKAGAPFS
jgi:CheY-like chemotaxis protein